MALLARHRYFINRLSEAFEYPTEDEIEQMMLSPEVLQAIDFFFAADGPTKIIMSVETVAKSTKQQTPVEKRLRVHVTEPKTFPTTAVYFVKPKRGRDNEDHYAIDPSKFNDGMLSFGVIKAPLESLEVVMRCVYRPMIQDMGVETWGEANTDQRNEFLMSLDTFSRGLQDSIRSLSGGLELKKPDERVETLGNAAVSDAQLIIKSLNLLQEWCINIEKYLDDSDRSRWETIDSGPDSELNYWKNRMQRLVDFFHS